MTEPITTYDYIAILVAMVFAINAICILFKWLKTNKKEQFDFCPFCGRELKGEGREND